MNILQNKILDEIVSKSEYNETIDKILIKRLIYLTIDAEKLNYQFDKIVFSNDEQKDFFARYLNSNIEVNLFKINNNTTNDLLKHNLSVVKEILFAVEMLKQDKKIAKNDMESFILNHSGKTFETISYNENLPKLLKAGKIVFNKRINEKITSRIDERYKNIYPIEPRYRIANIESTEKIIDFSTNSRKMINNYGSVIQALKESDKKNKTQGYYKSVFGHLSIPLVDYYNIIGTPNTIENLNIYSNNYQEFLNESCAFYNQEERLKYGLPVTEKELSNYKRR